MTNKDLANKIWLQQEALRSLPDKLREEAIKIDENPPPANRPFASFETPPIKGFDHKIYTKVDSDEDEFESSKL